MKSCGSPRIAIGSRRSCSNDRYRHCAEHDPSRAAIDDCWSRDVAIYDCVHGDYENALVLRHTPVSGLCSNASTAKNVRSAVNSRGIPRAIYMERHRPADTTLVGCRFSSGHASGVRTCGSLAGLFRDNSISFMNDALFAGRDPTLLYTGGTPYAASAFSTNQFNTALYGEFARQGEISGLYCSTNTSLYYEVGGSNRWSAQIMISDWYGLTMNDVNASNAGQSPSTAGAWQNGVAFYDALDVSGGLIRTDGQFGGVIFYNMNNVRIDSLMTHENAGVGVGILLRSIATATTNVAIDYWSAAVTYPLIEQAASVGEVSVSTLRIGAATFQGQTAEDVLLAQNQTATTTSAGDVCQLSDDGAPDYNPIWIVPTTADASKLGVVFGYGASNGVNMLVARLGDRRVTASSGAVAVGDKIVGTIASKEAAVDNAATLPILGVSATRKAAGAPGTIVVLETP